MASKAKPNQIRPVCFSGPHIQAWFVDNVRDYPIRGQTLVVNPRLSNAYIDEPPRNIIPPLSSTILQNTAVEKAAGLILLQIVEVGNIGNIILEPGWALYGNLLGPAPADENPSAPTFPRNTLLWRSPQEDLGVIKFDPYSAAGQTRAAPTPFAIKINLWFAPSNTSCYIHNQHDFRNPYPSLWSGSDAKV